MEKTAKSTCKPSPEIYSSEKYILSDIQSHVTIQSKTKNNVHVFKLLKP